MVFILEQRQRGFPVGYLGQAGAEEHHAHINARRQCRRGLQLAQQGADQVEQGQHTVE